MDFLLGKDAKLYYGPADTELASLTELTNVRNAKVTLSAGEADVSTRGNAGWKATAPTQRECTLEFEMLWLPGDAGFEALKTAFLASGTVALAALTGASDATNSEGPRGNWSIIDFSRDEGLEAAIIVSVTAKIAKYEEWVKVV
ncbi:MAG: hypothetical protein JXQ75_03180 [Phycisphaerae bacterium]|nr:hypothetical protein [Phycisphaerae bacterium]